MSMLNPHIFRAYDIRGITTGETPELSAELARALGSAYVTWIKNKSEAIETKPKLVVGHDNRSSGESLALALIAGMLDAGAEVDYLDYATSPYLYFSVCQGNYAGGINVTGSHNPPEYNGFKLTRAQAMPIAGAEIQEIRAIMESRELKNNVNAVIHGGGGAEQSEDSRNGCELTDDQQLTTDDRRPTTDKPNAAVHGGGGAEQSEDLQNGCELTDDQQLTTDDRRPTTDKPNAAVHGGGGVEQSEDLQNGCTPTPTTNTPPLVSYQKEYFEQLTALAPRVKKLKLVLDCGNGTAGYFSPEFFRALGHEIVELYCEPDPSFPNHLPNPEETETLHDLQKKVVEMNADLGLAWDGDGDRVGVVNERGEIISPDQLIILLARDLLQRRPGAEIIFDVKCSNILPTEIVKAGGVATRWKTGHSFIKQKMRETGALLAGEVSGHIFFAENYYGVDDGLLAAAHIVSIVSRGEKKISEYFRDLPTLVTTPEIKLPVADTAKFSVIEKITAEFTKQFECDTLDGVRVNFDAFSWALIRASNTSPYLTLRFESDTLEHLTARKKAVLATLRQFPELEGFRV